MDNFQGFTPQPQWMHLEPMPQTPWLLLHTVAKQKWYAPKSPGESKLMSLLTNHQFEKFIIYSSVRLSYYRMHTMKERLWNSCFLWMEFSGRVAPKLDSVY